MDSKKFNMSHLPSEDARPLEGEYKKTVLLLYGLCNTGKSTLTNLMLNDNFNYISVDRACIEANFEPIKSYVEQGGTPLRYDLGKLFKFVNDECASEFIDYFFTKYLVENENLNIFIEGFVFMLERPRTLFMQKCKDAGYRVWIIRREL